MREINDKTILTLFLVSIVVSVTAAYLTISSVNKLGSTSFFPITGLATSPNGTATVTIATYSSITFTAATVSFGSGSVNSSIGGLNNCTLDTRGTTRGCVDFTAVSAGFVVENDGNTNLTIELVSNATVLQFIGESSGIFGWNVSLNESGSCRNISTAPADTPVNPNTTTECGSSNIAGSACGSIFEAVTTGGTGKVVCPRLLFDDPRDALRIDINITMPVGTPAGSKGAKLTVTGTRHPTS